MNLAWAYKYKQRAAFSLSAELLSRNLLVFLFLNTMADVAKDSRTIHSCSIFFCKEMGINLHAGLQNLLLVVLVSELFSLQ